MKNQRKLIILTGPSGVGKGTVVKEILGKDKNIWLSISATTRQPRDGEKAGENYYFLSLSLKYSTNLIIIINN